MKNYVMKNCKECQQKLRIPADIGGMLMRCPNCGYEFHTDFKLNMNVGKGGSDTEPNPEMPTQRPLSTFTITV